jgi:hemerythrin-like metal-binding protein
MRGDAEIDREHRQLFDLANALLQVSAHPQASRQAISSALQTLLDHIVHHFDHEEAILARQRYAGLDDHKRAHATLLARAGELKVRVDGGRATIGDLVEFLADSVVAQHMLSADKDYFPLFKA